jgi:FkbM family methyltransferase
MNKTFRVGRFELQLPQDHLLDDHREKFKLYDLILAEIARRVVQKYPDAVAIDIGANVGDSAAILCSHQDIPVLCIEGHPLFASFLRQNLPHLPSCIEAVECLVGASVGTVSPENLQTAGGTAKLTPDLAINKEAVGALQVRPLTDILRSHPRFQRPQLIKIDTDGSDFEIILSSIELIRAVQPVLFFEYDPTFRKDGMRSGMKVISELQAAGYEQFLVYDNFGHFMDRIGRDATARFADLNRYIMSHYLFGQKICYVDLCAFSAKDTDLAEQIYNHRRDAIDAQIGRAGWQTL